MPSDKLEDVVDLFRIVWSPDDVRDGQVQPAAFSKNDLRGLERTLSVDRIDKLVPSVVRATASAQAIKPSYTGKSREVAYSTLLNVGSVRKFSDDEGIPPFLVQSDPVKDEITGIENPAHCKIANVSGKVTKGYLLQLQTTLASLTFSTSLLDKALSEIEAGER